MRAAEQEEFGRIARHLSELVAPGPLFSSGAVFAEDYRESAHRGPTGSESTIVVSLPPPLWIATRIHFTPDSMVQETDSDAQREDFDRLLQLLRSAQ